MALLLIAGPATAFSPTLAEAQTTATSGTAPLINLSSGQNIEGTVPVVVEPVTENDSVTTLAVDGDRSDADKTAGTAHFAFEMGGNGTEARYRNYLTVNAHTAETDRIYLPDIAGGQVGTLDFPGDWLQPGTNTVTVHAGANWVDTTTKTAVGYEELPNGEGGRCPNYDDYALSSISLSLLGVVADGEQNLFSYSFGDGTCGTSAKLLNQDLTFVISGEPGSTSGLRTDLDTTKLTNGTHTVSASTQSGAKTSVTVDVNNAPAGAAVVTPVTVPAYVAPAR
ncbi:hypothetical protein NKG94_32725 [Micromonospora sp. M12]